MPCHRSTLEGRLSMEAFLRNGASAADIVRVLGRHRGAVYRELKLNSSPLIGSHHSAGISRGAGSEDGGQGKGKSVTIPSCGDW